VIARREQGVPLRVERQPENPHDANAIALFDPFGDQVGFFNRRLAAALAPSIDKRHRLRRRSHRVTGGEVEQSFGVNVLVVRRDLHESTEASADLRAERRSELAALASNELDTALVRLFLGERHLSFGTGASSRAPGRRRELPSGDGYRSWQVARVPPACGAHRPAPGPGVGLRVSATGARRDQAFHLEETFAERDSPCAP